MKIASHKKRKFKNNGWGYWASNGEDEEKYALFIEEYDLSADIGTLPKKYLNTAKEYIMNIVKL